jgi:hypothetical protein
MKQTSESFKTAIYGRLPNNDSILLLSKDGINNSRLLTDDEIMKLKDVQRINLSKAVRNFKLREIDGMIDNNGLQVHGTSEYGAYTIKKDSDDLNEEAQKLADFFGQTNLSLRFPRFGLIKTRTNDGKKLFACPIKIEEINNSMFVDMIGEFELECRGAGK